MICLAVHSALGTLSVYSDALNVCTIEQAKALAWIILRVFNAQLNTARDTGLAIATTCSVKAVRNCMMSVWQ